MSGDSPVALCDARKLNAFRRSGLNLFLQIVPLADWR
jgi:hypothetical protein